MNGTMNGGIVAGKKSAFVWLLNNTMTGCTRYALSSGGYNRAVSGNIMYNAGVKNNVMWQVHTMQGEASTASKQRPTLSWHSN